MSEGAAVLPDRAGAGKPGLIPVDTRDGGCVPEPRCFPRACIPRGALAKAEAAMPSPVSCPSLPIDPTWRVVGCTEDWYAATHSPCGGSGFVPCRQLLGGAGVSDGGLSADAP